MSKPTKTELKKYASLLIHQRNILKGDVGSMRDEALRASEQDASVDHLADQGTDNYDQGFMLGLIENEEETIAMIDEALERIDGRGDWEYGICPVCDEEGSDEPKGAKAAAKNGKAAKVVKAAKKVQKKPARPKVDPWIPKARLEYIPWARYCVKHQQDAERNREIA